MKTVICYTKIPSEIIQNKLHPFLNRHGLNPIAVVCHKRGILDKKKMDWPSNVKIQHTFITQSIEDIDPTLVDVNLFNSIFQHDIIRLYALLERGENLVGTMQVHNRALYWFSKALEIISLQPAIILFVHPPERAIHFIIYKVANYYQIKTYLLRTGFGYGTRVVCTDLDTPILDKDLKVSDSVLNFCPSKPLMDQMNHCRIQWIDQIKSQSYKPQIEKYNFNFNLSPVQLRKAALRILMILKKDKTDAFQKLKLKRYYDSKCIDPIFNGNDIYFPLHNQPELSSMPYGYEYANQGIALAKLSVWAGKTGRKIFVKEHYATHSFWSKNNIPYRCKELYDFMESFGNVYFIPSSYPSQVMIDSCEYTATVNGTAGAEALAKNKKVIVFGNAPYRNFPNCYFIDDIESTKRVESKFGFLELVRRLDNISFLSPEELNGVDEQSSQYYDVMAFVSILDFYFENK